MAATRDEISDWFDRGVTQQATHMIVVCDTFDYDDYPVYVKTGEDARTEADKCNRQNMQRVMEVYDLRKDKHPQITEDRWWNF